MVTSLAWPRGLRRFYRAAGHAVAAGDPPGLVALVWRDNEIFDAALGLRGVEENLPMRRDTIFRLTSMTKPITSALILMLMEEGKLRLEDPVVKWAPELANRRVLKDPAGPIDDTYPARRDITIGDLLTHRSGLAEAFTSRGAIADAYERGVPNSTALTPEEFLAALAPVYNDAEPTYVSRSRHGPYCLLQDGKHRHSEVGFRRSMAGLRDPLSTLRFDPHGSPRMPRG
jgi:CubicO group peptidase (beta-lactamase class C family)